MPRAGRRDAEEEVEIVEDERRNLKDGMVEVRGHWVVRAMARPGLRRAHRSGRPQRG
jgi:hypothetical protein